MKSRQLGQHGESLARVFLEQAGFEILQCNWRYGQFGEIDIIAYSPKTLTLKFVEVKTRRNTKYGEAHEAITPVKQEKIRILAEAYLATQPDFQYNQVSFDVITVVHQNNGQPPVITFYESAF